MANPTPAEAVGNLRLILLQVIPQGVAPTPCIPCCLVVTDRKLLTCHQDCQTSFFRSLGSVDVCDVTAVRLEAKKQYCVIVSCCLIRLRLWVICSLLLHMDYMLHKRKPFCSDMGDG